MTPSFPAYFLLKFTLLAKLLVPEVETVPLLAPEVATVSLLDPEVETVSLLDHRPRGFYAGGELGAGVWLVVSEELSRKKAPKPL